MDAAMMSESPEQMPAGAPQTKPRGTEGMASVVQAIKVPPEFQDAYQRVVVAGMKVMFSKETSQLLQDQMNRPGTIADRIAEGVVGLILILWKKSNETIPPQVLAPALLTLVVEAAEFLEDAGEEVTPKDVAAASKSALKLFLEKFGSSQEQIQGLFGGGTDQAAAREAGAAEAQQPEAPQGIVSGSMQEGM